MMKTLNINEEKIKKRLFKHVGSRIILDNTVVLAITQECINNDIKELASITNKQNIERE